ncbi:MAG: SGNH/GDSL hydrolase family protein [Chthoniobacteraceae bacterium]
MSKNTLKLFVCVFTSLALQVFPVTSRGEAIPAVPVDQGAEIPAALPVVVAPSEVKLRYEGRFNTAKPDAVVCAWSASAITIRFHGTAINADMDLVTNNRFEVVVDGVPQKVLAWAETPGRRLYRLASELPDADHTVTIFKCTQGYSPTVSFFGFQLNPGAAVLNVPAANGRIEVIGDSISTGVGNEAANEKEPYSANNENAFWSYGAITARAFGAEYACYALGGKCLWPDNTISSLYDRTIPLAPASPTWNFEKWKPQVVLINLGTNDFNKGIPEEEGWVKAYHDFVDRVRKNYPEALIYLALGPILNDEYPAGANRLSICRKYIQRVKNECNAGGDPQVRFLEFYTQDRSLGLGAGWHPSVKRHQYMAKQFSAAIEKDLGWTQAVPSAVPK